MIDISNELVVRAAQGDMAAFEEIYRAASGFVYNVVLRITNNRSDADEVTQDVFVRVYNNIRGFGFRSSFTTWLYRVAANTAINHCKRSARQVSRNVEYNPAVHDVEAPAAQDTAIDREDAEEKVASLLEMLDPDQRACIVLREMEGFDYRAIADTLHININTVRSRLNRARRRILDARGRKG